jgi:hypothetical protein
VSSYITVQYSTVQSSSGRFIQLTQGKPKASPSLQTKREESKHKISMSFRRMILSTSNTITRTRSCSAGSIDHTVTVTVHGMQIRCYFTNGDRVKREDPYAVLGLQWGDGATTTEIKAAYKKQAALLHPDVNRSTSTSTNTSTTTSDSSSNKSHVEKFQDLQRAYQTLLKLSENINAAENMDEWRFAIWNKGDRIAVDRTDVAGVAKKRPAEAADRKDKVSSVSGLLGHPNGRGVVDQRRSNRRGEYLSDGSSDISSSSATKGVSSSVGRGLNKWVTPKEFVPWNGGGGKKGSTVTSTSTAAASKGRASETDDANTDVI